MVAVLLTLLVLLQFPADFGSVAYAAQKNEIRGTISVASNISQQDMQQYLDGFNKKNEIPEHGKWLRDFFEND